MRAVALGVCATALAAVLAVGLLRTCAHELDARIDGAENSEGEASRGDTGAPPLAERAERVASRERPLSTSSFSAGGALRGRVRDARGHVLSGVALECIDVEAGRVVARSESGFDGRFTLAVAPALRLRLHAAKSGYVSGTLTVANRPWVDVSLRASLSIFGRATDARTRSACRRYSVEAQRIDDPDADLEGGRAIEARIAQDRSAAEMSAAPATSLREWSGGRYELRGLAPGRYIVLAATEDGLTTIEGPFDLQSDTRRDLVLREGVAWRLRVLDSRGRGVEGAQACVEHESGDEPRCASSGATGAATLRGLWPGPSTVQIGAEGFVPLSIADIEIRAGMQERVFRLKRGATLSGRVRSRSPGLPLRVRIVHAKGRVTVAKVSESGEYSAHGLDAGEHVLHVEEHEDRVAVGVEAGLHRAFARARSRSRRVELASGTRTRVDLEYFRTRLVRVVGRLRVDGALRTRGFVVELRARAANRAFAGLARGLDGYLRSTIESGRYRIRWVPPGRYELRVLHSGLLLSRQALDVPAVVAASGSSASAEITHDLQLTVLSRLDVRLEGERRDGTIVIDALERRFVVQDSRTDFGPVVPGRYSWRWHDEARGSARPFVVHAGARTLRL